MYSKEFIKRRTHETVETTIINLERAIEGIEKMQELLHTVHLSNEIQLLKNIIEALRKEEKDARI